LIIENDAVLDEDGDDQQHNGDADQPELFFQAMLFVMMPVMLFVSATFTMMVFMKMCHIFAF
jgi:hypothetical protein